MSSEPKIQDKTNSPIKQESEPKSLTVKRVKREYLKPEYQEYWTAVNFLFKVRRRLKENNPSHYKQFEKILKSFRMKQQAIYKKGRSEENINGLIRNVKEQMSELLGNDIELAQSFKYFLPSSLSSSFDFLNEIKQKLFDAESKESVNYKLRVIKEMRDNLPPRTYKLLLRSLNLYNNKIVDYKELLTILSSILRMNYPETLNQFCEAIGVPVTIRERKKRSQKKISPRITPSYVELSPVSETEEPDNVLNTRFVCVPKTQEDLKYSIDMKNNYEQQLQKLDDDRYELDILVAISKTIVEKLEKLKDFTPEKIRELRIENKGIHSYLDVSECRTIKELYGVKGDFVLNMISVKPRQSGELIKGRLQEKQKEWQKVRERFSTMWKQMCVNEWIYSNHSYTTQTKSSFKVDMNEDHLWNELQKCILYCECYSITERYSNDKILDVLDSQLNVVLKKHMDFLEENGLPKPLHFLPKIKEIQNLKEKLPNQMNFSLPEDSSLEITFQLFCEFASSLENIESLRKQLILRDETFKFELPETEEDAEEDEDSEKRKDLTIDYAFMTDKWYKEMLLVPSSYDKALLSGLKNVFFYLFNMEIKREDQTDKVVEVENPLKILKVSGCKFTPEYKLEGNHRANVMRLRYFIGDRNWFIFTRRLQMLTQMISEFRTDFKEFPFKTIFGKILSGPHVILQESLPEVNQILRIAGLFYKTIHSLSRALQDKKSHKLFESFVFIQKHLYSIHKNGYWSPKTGLFNLSDKNRVAKHLLETKYFHQKQAGIILPEDQKIAENLCEMLEIYQNETKTICDYKSLVNITHDLVESYISFGMLKRSNQLNAERMGTYKAREQLREELEYQSRKAQEKELKRKQEERMHAEFAKRNRMRQAQNPPENVNINESIRRLRLKTQFGEDQNNPFFSRTPGRNL